MLLAAWKRCCKTFIIDKNMKKIIALLSSVLLLSSISSATPETEKNFTDAYKKAFEGKDETTLKSFLYTKDAIPEALEFYTMMMTSEMGAKIASIELRNLNAEETKKATAMMPSPDGTNSKMPVTPTKKLVLKIETSGESGTSTSSSETFVAEVDGKFVIPVPVAVK